MTKFTSHASKAAIVIAVFTLSACQIPRSGPTISEITSTNEKALLDVDVRQITPEVAAATRVDMRSVLGQDFLSAAPETNANIGIGDVLAVTVWENVDQGLYNNAAGAGATVLDALEVDENGRIFVPYAGSIRAAGRSVSRLRSVIRATLEKKTLSPQVEVRILHRNSRQASVQGSVGAPGVYPIDNFNNRLLPMIAAAGGSGTAATVVIPEATQVVLRRGDKIGRIWLEDAYEHPEYNVALRNGDTIIVSRFDQAFTAMGAVTTQGRVQFPNRNINLIDALALAGGVDDIRGDPTGIFVFRTETPQVVAALDLTEPPAFPRHTVYQLSLAQQQGIPLAKDFQIRDGDTVYVTNAPLEAWRKVLSVVVPTIGFGATTAVIADKI